MAAGARTGLASVVTGVLLLLCMFISPIAGIIPTEATAQALVIVGVMMFALVRDLRWDNTSPLATFATIIVMPVTYSIANGVGVGILLHTATEILNRRRVSPLLVDLQRLLHLVLPARNRVSTGLSPRRVMAQRGAPHRVVVRAEGV